MSQARSRPSRVIPVLSRTRAEATLSTSVTAHTRRIAGWASPHSTTRPGRLRHEALPPPRPAQHVADLGAVAAGPQLDQAEGPAAGPQR